MPPAALWNLEVPAKPMRSPTVPEWEGGLRPMQSTRAPVWVQLAFALLVGGRTGLPEGFTKQLGWKIIHFALVTSLVQGLWLRENKSCLISPTADVMNEGTEGLWLWVRCQGLRCWHDNHK